MAARAITSQRRAAAGLLSTRTSSVKSSSLLLPKSCSCVGSSTLATCCDDHGIHLVSQQQQRNNSISVSAAAALLGNHPGGGGNLAVDVEPEHHYGPLDPGTNIDSFFDDKSLLGTLKRINDGAGRRKNKSRTAKKTGADATLSTLKDMLAELTQKKQEQAPPTSTAAAALAPKFHAPSLDVARSMPLSCRQMDNTSLMCLAALDVVEARSEVLRRHIME